MLVEIPGANLRSCEQSLSCLICSRINDGGTVSPRCGVGVSKTARRMLMCHRILTYFCPTTNRASVSRTSRSADMYGCIRAWTSAFTVSRTVAVRVV
jgi:hypothetical protein